MIIVLKHFWVAFIIVTVVNVYIMKARSKKYISENPELEEGYDKLFKGIIIYGNIPWVIIGVGMLFGLTQTIFDFFQPRSMNIIVLIFHLYIVALWVLAVWWIYFKNGAEFIEKHPSFMQSRGGNGVRTIGHLFLEVLRRQIGEL